MKTVAIIQLYVCVSCCCVYYAITASFCAGRWTTASSDGTILRLQALAVHLNTHFQKYRVPLIGIYATLRGLVIFSPAINDDGGLNL